MMPLDFPGRNSQKAAAAFASLVPQMGTLIWPHDSLDCSAGKIGLDSAFGLHAISPYQDGTFAFKEDGNPALIIGVHGPSMDDPVDLIAWFSGRPGIWWSRFDAAPILGCHSVEHAIHFDTPLIIRETPESWVRSGCDGAVVLDWQAAGLYLAGAKRLFGETATIAASLRKTFAAESPEIRVLPSEFHHAA